MPPRTARAAQLALIPEYVLAEALGEAKKLIREHGGAAVEFKLTAYLRHEVGLSVRQIARLLYTTEKNINRRLERWQRLVR